jgi:hypothetical protein
MTLLELAAKIETLTGRDKTITDRLDRSGDCWLWVGRTDKSGRGQVFRNGKRMIHHRAVWEILVSPIPPGNLLCHHCDNPRCANPLHIYVGDNASNVKDMFERGRHWTQIDPVRAAAVGLKNGQANNWSSGEANPKAKLKLEQVEAIRRDVRPTRFLAADYGVSCNSIQRIRSGKQWRSRASMVQL